MLFKQIIESTSYSKKVVAIVTAYERSFPLLTLIRFVCVNGNTGGVTFL